ncbi:MAG: sulfatase-like hydrolase/transferase [Deltaproteobacteria bacterium]|nr:sulfatase-like hydrolase/transferase [Deltaproteobacteria bacterium]
MFASYRSGLAISFGAILPAAMIVAIIDGLLTGSNEAIIPLLGLWSIVAVPAALLVGLAIGATRATWAGAAPSKLLRRLREDLEFDRAVFAGLASGLVVAVVFALVAGRLADVFVGDLRTHSGGWFEIALLGIAVVSALVTLILSRIIRWISRKLTAEVALSPPLLVVVVVGFAAAAAAGAWLVVLAPTDPSSAAFAATVPVIAIALLGAAYGPLDQLRLSVPRRPTIVAILTVVVAGLPLVTLRAVPSVQVSVAVIDRSAIGSLVDQLRTRLDHDDDGFSAFFGGPDCDDDLGRVHPNATEIPGNGIDDNCFGGDAAVEPSTADPPVAAQPPAPLQRRNLLIVFVDSLRFDRLGVAGYRRDGKSLTPRIDGFAAEAVVFRKAFAQAPATLRSAPSFLGSRYPSQLAVDRPYADYPTILDSNDLLFEVLQASGFTTLGQSSHFYFCDDERYPRVCDKFPRRMRSNVLQGADEWDNTGAVDIAPSNADVAGPRIVAKTVARLEELSTSARPFAMLVHLFDPHSTYMPHAEWPITERGERGLAQKYDYEIAFEDQMVGRILDALERTGLAKTTVVALVSDHGEAFGAHAIAGERLFFHGHSLYRELLHVPLMFRVPELPGRVVDDVVELVDLAPTICALFGIPPARSWIGRSLLPLMRGQPLSAKPAFAELIPAPWWNHEMKSMVSSDGTRHVLYRVTDRRWEIYDLVNDPDEKIDISRTDPRAEDLKAELRRWIDGPLVAGGGSCMKCTAERRSAR